MLKNLEISPYMYVISLEQYGVIFLPCHSKIRKLTLRYNRIKVQIAIKYSILGIFQSFNFILVVRNKFKKYHFYDSNLYQEKATEVATLLVWWSMDLLFSCVGKSKNITRRNYITSFIGIRFKVLPLNLNEKIFFSIYKAYPKSPFVEDTKHVTKCLLRCFIGTKP